MFRIFSRGSFNGKPWVNHDNCSMGSCTFLWQHLGAIKGPAWECRCCGSMNPATAEEIAYFESLEVAA